MFKKEGFKKEPEPGQREQKIKPPGSIQIIDLDGNDKDPLQPEVDKSTSHQSTS